MAGELVPLDVLALDETLQREVLFGVQVEDACGTVLDAQIGPRTLVDSDRYCGG